MHIGTCGHKIEEGISCSIDEGRITGDGSPAITYGTYCASCVERFYRAGILKNGELEKILSHITEVYERRSYFKKMYETLRTKQ
jgi:hypothetical protein